MHFLKKNNQRDVKPFTLYIVKNTEIRIIVVNTRIYDKD